MPSPTAQYEAEQQALREQHGQEDTSGDEHISYEVPEVNPEIWKDMDPLLFRGFTYQACSIGDIPLVLKSLNQHELERVFLATRLMPDSGVGRKRYALMLAMGVWMVDGENVLVDREQNLRSLQEFFLGLPSSALEHLVRSLSELNRRANRAAMLTEAYVYEQLSRFRWQQIKGTPLSSSAITGVQGSEFLGLNWGQLAWQALNRIEDQRLESEAQWENTKFIASAMTGSKGMSRINSTDKTRRKGEREDRIARRDKVIKQAVFGEKAAKEEGGQVIQVARTVEELAAQLEKDLRGEKDWHDQVVDAYQRQINDTEKARQEHLQELRAIHAQDMAGRMLTGATDFRGLSKEEVEAHLRARLQQSREAEASTALPLSALDPVAAERAERWSNALPLATPSKEPSSGAR